MYDIQRSQEFNMKKRDAIFDGELIHHEGARTTQREAPTLMYRETRVRMLTSR